MIVVVLATVIGALYSVPAVSLGVVPFVEEGVEGGAALSVLLPHRWGAARTRKGKLE